MTITPEQKRICDLYGVSAFDAPLHYKAGVARNVQGSMIPVNGLRHPPLGDTTGWYIWAGGESSTDPEFFQPLHLEHLKEIRPEVMKYLALPPGWRFLVAVDYEDVWYDATLLTI